jgi:hypothetical protein
MAFHLVFFHLITSFLPLLLLMVGSFCWSRFRKYKTLFSVKENFFLLVYGPALLMYNLVFMEWSYEHEFSIIPWAPLFAYLAAKWMAPLWTRKNTAFITAFYLVMTIFQYYFINRPGKISRDGMAYDNFQISGEHIRQVAPEYKIYSPLERPAPMIEYYAGRNITIAPSYREARLDMRQTGVDKAVWINQDHYRLEEIIVIK